MTTIRGTHLRIDATRDGMVILFIPDVGEMELTWVDATDLAYGVSHAAATAAHMVGADLDAVQRVTAAARQRMRNRQGGAS